MKIRQFMHKGPGPENGWDKLAYIEFRDSTAHHVTPDGTVTSGPDIYGPTWTLEEAERLVKKGYWVELGTATAMPEVRSLHDQELFDFFREFRYAKVTTGGVGNGTYSRALAWIDNEVRIRVSEALKGKQ